MNYLDLEEMEFRADLSHEGLSLLTELKVEWEEKYEQSKTCRREQIKEINNFISLCKTKGLEIPNWVYEAKNEEVSKIHQQTDENPYVWVLNDIQKRLENGEETIPSYYYLNH